MCLGIPMQVVSVAGTTAVCRGRDGEARVDIALVAPVAPGEWLLTFLGAARGRLEGDLGDAAGVEPEGLDEAADTGLDVRGALLELAVDELSDALLDLRDARIRRLAGGGGRGGPYGREVRLELREIEAGRGFAIRGNPVG